MGRNPSLPDMEKRPGRQCRNATGRASFGSQWPNSAASPAGNTEADIAGNVPFPGTLGIIARTKIVDRIRIRHRNQSSVHLKRQG
jgi:hypothetical protein